MNVLALVGLAAHVDVDWQNNIAKYKTIEAFGEDVGRIVANACAYNGKEEPVHKMALYLKKHYDTIVVPMVRRLIVTGCERCARTMPYCTRTPLIDDPRLYI